MHNTLMNDTSGSEKPHRLQIILWLLVMAIFLGAALQSYGSFQLGVYQDDAAYVVLAQSLVSGAHYGMINRADANTLALFPFGYPLLLAPFAYFFPAQPELMRWLSLAATLLNGVLLFWKWRSYSPSTSYWWGLSVTALYLFSPLTLAHSQMVMSEAVFTSFVLGALLVLSHIRIEKVRFWQLALASVLLVFVVFIRSIGVTLVGAVFIYWLVTYRRRAVLPLLGLGLGMLVVTSILVAVTNVEPADLVPGRYLKEFNSAPAHANAANAVRPSIWNNLREYGTAGIRNIVVPIGNGGVTANLLRRLGASWLLRVFGAFITLVTVLGAWMWYRKEGLQLPLFFGIVYMFTLLIWSWSLPRLLYPIQPQIFLAFLLGLVTVATSVTRRIPATPLVKYTAAALVVVILLVMELFVTARSGSTQAQLGDLAERTAWLRTHTPANVIIITQYPQVDFLYGGRKTMTPQEMSASTQNTYVLIAPKLDWTPDTGSGDGNPEENLHKQMQAREQAHTASLVFQDSSHKIYIYQLLP